VPLDTRGVSRGKPLNKIGQRALNQGAVIFDEVELPLDYVLAGPDDYKQASYSILSDGNAIMGVVFTGAARAVFELALAYAHERKQGGMPIIRHQSAAYRLFHMYRKVEAARALSRRVLIYNYTRPVPAMHVAMASKITGTQTSFEVASEALQIFCGKGLIPEYPIEKLFRLQMKIIKTFVQVPTQWHASSGEGFLLRVGDSTHRMAGHLRALGLDGARPVLVQYADPFQSLLFPGIAL
jgi:acyl-CoA dehydrogenase